MGEEVGKKRILILSNMSTFCLKKTISTMGVFFAISTISPSFSSASDQEKSLIASISQELNSDAFEYLGGSHSNVSLFAKQCEIVFERKIRTKCDLPAQYLSEIYNIDLSEISSITASKHGGHLFTHFKLTKDTARIADDAKQLELKLYKEKQQKRLKEQKRAEIPTEIIYQQKMDEIAIKIAKYLSDKKMKSVSYISNCSGITTHLAPLSSGYTIALPVNTSKKLIRDLNLLKDTCSK